MTALLLALSMAAAAGAADFRSSARGTTAAEFLNLGVGARAEAMGQAISAAADDATAVYWNPAAITNVEERSVALMHAALLASTSLDYAGYAHNGGDYGFFGVGLQYFSAGNLTQSDTAGNVNGNFNPYDLAISFTYARRIAAERSFGGWSWGLSAKLIDSRILNSASAGAIDVGLLSRPLFDEKFRWAFTASNLGGDRMQFEQAQETLPVRLRLGTSYRFSRALLGTLDATALQGDRPYAGGGLEYWFVPEGTWRLAGRAGFNTRTVGSISGFTGASMGFGLSTGGCPKGLSGPCGPAWGFDYALAPFGGLGQAHRLSVRVNF